MTTRQRQIFYVVVPIALFFVGLLYPFDYGYRDTVIQRLGDVLHIPIFFVVTAFINRFVKSVAKASALSAALTIGIELIQPFTGRSESWIDLRNGLVGIAAFAAWKLISPRVGALIIVAGTGVAILPAFDAMKLREYQQSIFPVLADFQNIDARKLWTPSDSGEDKAELNFGHNSLLVRTASNQYSGAEFDAFGFDWKGYSKLRIEVVNERIKAIKLNIRIDDRSKKTENFDSRYNGTFEIGTGNQAIEIPFTDIAAARNGQLNISDISRILIFMDPLPESQTFIIKKLTLI